MASQDQFLEPLLKLHEYFNRTKHWYLFDLNEALGIFLTTDRQSVKPEVQRATLASAMDLIGYILNFKQHLRKMFPGEANEDATRSSLECNETIKIMIARLTELSESNEEHQETIEQQDFLQMSLNGLTCHSPPDFQVSFFDIKKILFARINPRWINKLDK